MLYDADKKQEMLDTLNNRVTTLIANYSTYINNKTFNT